MTREDSSSAQRYLVTSPDPTEGSGWQTGFATWLRSTSTLTKVVGAASVVMVTASVVARAETSCGSRSAVSCSTSGDDNSAVTENVNGPSQTSLVFINNGTINNDTSGYASVNALGYARR